MNARKYIQKNKYSSGRKNYGAFSFVEIMVAVVLISIGLIPLFSLFVSTTSDVSNTIDEVLATTYANELIDSIIAHKFVDIPSSVAYSEVQTLAGSPFFDKIIANLTPCSSEFRRYVEISETATTVQIPANVSPLIAERYNRIKSFKIVKIKIKYDLNGRARELNMATIVTGA
ncbi:MAG TPA: prepilin-type N-terminal cleavage/methylation domain-containing protein [Candidatus Wallbacteria bacterium]|nr:prepilin-type N-terminal cleavage/methylation domain-containing protein [Candidatus Wallbacteria bacterium]